METRTLGLTRKQRELKEREAKILDVSRPMLVQSGYHGLSMDRIAETLQYAKGTIYNHFRCKEEIIISLAIETMEKRTDLFRRAAAFPGSSRERVVAVGMAAEIFVRLYPDHFMVEHLIRSASIWEKTSAERRDLMRSCETQCVSTVAGLVRDAIAQGDLQLAQGTAVEDLVFGLWSLTYGGYSIIGTSQSLGELGVSEPFGVVRDNCDKLLDGYGWLPLAGDHNFNDARNRIRNKVFSDECDLLDQG